MSAYIDGANLFHGGENLGVRLDYQKLKSLIAQNRALVDLNFYDATKNTEAERSFFRKIQGFGYSLKLFRLHVYGSQTPHEKRIDTQIVADSLVDGLVKDRFDIAVFGTGDKDVIPSIEYLIDGNKKVEIISFRASLAWDLKNCGAKITYLDEMIDRIRRI